MPPTKDDPITRLATAVADDLAGSIADNLSTTAETCSDGATPANVVDGMFAIARGLERVAASIRALGIADAADPRGAVEILAMEVRDGLARLAGAMKR